MAMIPRAISETDPLALAITAATNSLNIQPPQSGGGVSTAAQIHVHHFHHQSCLHNPDLNGVSVLQIASHQQSQLEDDYAVVLNATNGQAPSSHSKRQAFASASSVSGPKYSSSGFAVPRRATCTATIRHPSLAALCLHDLRPPVSLEETSPSHQFMQISATSPSIKTVEQLPAAPFLKDTTLSSQCCQSSTSGTSLNGLRQAVYAAATTSSPCQKGRVAYAPTECQTTGRAPGNASLYYRLPPGYPQPQPTSRPELVRALNNNNNNNNNSNANLTTRLLKWFGAGDCGGAGGGGGVAVAELDGESSVRGNHRGRSKSQPPQRQRMKVVALGDIDPRGLHASHEATGIRVHRQNCAHPASQHPTSLVGSNAVVPAVVASNARSTQYAPLKPAPNRHRDLPSVPCSCTHHQIHPPAVSQHQRSRLRRWLFHCSPNAKHSLSPPPFTSVHPLTPPPRCEIPPPPPPRTNATANNNALPTPLKPSTRSVEVQTATISASSEASRCICAREDVAEEGVLTCCPTSIGPLLPSHCSCSVNCRHPHPSHVLLHHYHFHHYYHCDAASQGATPTTQQVSVVTPTQETDSRPASPLIKLSVNWPPTAALSTPTTRPQVLPLSTPPPPAPSTPRQSPEGERPAPVSNALQAIESAKVDTLATNSQLENEEEDEDIGMLVPEASNGSSRIGGNQLDQRKIFLQNINQLKRTGWYWGPLTIDEAELLLKDRPNGSFLVRDSGHELYILSVSFRAEGRTYHTRIEHTGGRFSFAVQGDADTTSPSIAQFINHVIAESERGRTRFFLRQSALTTSTNQQGATTITAAAANQQPAVEEDDENRHVEARLLYPVSRFLVVHSLVHLCRFEILLKVRKDHINQLPLPERLKHYLHERQYNTEFVQAYLESVGHLLPTGENTELLAEANMNVGGMAGDNDGEIEDQV